MARIVKKTAVSKASARKSSKRTPVVAKKTRVKKPIDAPTIKDRFTQSEFFDAVAERAEIDRRDVMKMWGAVVDLAFGALHPKGIGEISLPKLLRIQVKDVPAKRVPAQKAGIKKMNPFTREEYITEAKAAYTKPARVRIKGLAVKRLKDYALSGK